MPPKIVFTKSQITEAAFEIFKKEGIEGVTVRKLAAKLKSSTAPVYTCFKNIEEIKKSLLDKSLGILLEYTQKSFTDNIFLNIGVGTLEFARDYKTVYRNLFLNNSEYQYIFDEFTKQNILKMKKDANLNIFNDNELHAILDKMNMYTHGFAAFICAGMMKDESTKYFIKTMNEAGADVILAMALRKGINLKNQFCEGCLNEEDNNN